MPESQNLAKRLLARPAIRLPNGQIVEGRRGDTHQDLKDRHTRGRSRVTHGFIDKSGEFQTRQGARKLIQSKTGTNVGPGSPCSEDLF